MNRYRLAAIPILLLFLFAESAWSQSATTLLDVRFGQHSEFSRLVLYTRGPKPLGIGPGSEQGLPIRFEQLHVQGDRNRMFGRKGGAVARLTLDQENGLAVVTAVFQRPATRVKYFYMKGDDPADDVYRLVLDFYPSANEPGGPGTLVPALPPAGVAAPEKPAVAQTKVAAGGAVLAATPSSAQPSAAQGAAAGAVPTAPAAEGEKAPASGQTASSEASIAADPITPEEPIAGQWSGDVALIVNPVMSPDVTSSLFAQYKDFNAVSGEWKIRYDMPNRYFFKSDGQNIGQEDQYFNLQGGWYGKMDIAADHNEIPHRFAFDVRTLYSGVGSTTLSLDNQLQSDLQALAADPVAQAGRLVGATAGADTGDPYLKRTHQNVTMNLMALDPFSLNFELGKQKQEGTRPIFGSFGLSNTVELFEPIDNETLSAKLSAEYAGKDLLLNAQYYYQQFDNQMHALVFDNPMRIDDAIGGPSQGRLGLAPDNSYQNMSLSGSYMNLPLQSRISATAAWGWMTQDDDLLPYTVNPALNAPINYSDPAALPRRSADARVNTSLYNLQFTSQPVGFLDVKAGYRYFDYDNQSDAIVFSNGYVNSDSLPVLDTVKTLPVSYSKTKSDVDLGFHLNAATRLNLGYAYKTTDRTNSEVAHQSDNVFAGSVDTQPGDWIGLRLSYERTVTDIGDYNYQVYLDSGQDLGALPALRKYTQADANRDRVALTASLYPWQELAFSTTLTYGRDDYTGSPYGLMNDTYYAFTLEAGWAGFKGWQLHGFYTLEQYDNQQRARGMFDADNDGVPLTTDWEARGKDVIHTLGLGVDYAIIANKLTFNCQYTFSKTDGSIHFALPSGTLEDFDNVDDATLHSLDTGITYNFNKAFHLTVGFVWEKYDYSDYNNDGFTLVPTDGSGAYNGAVLAGTLPQSYDAVLVYTKLSFKF